MATRLQTDFYSEFGNKYTVFIDDSAFGGSVTSFDATSLQLNYSGNTKTRFNPIIATDLTVGMLITDSTLDAFATDLAGAKDGRFRIKVNKNDSLHWVGVVKTDSISKEDKPFPTKFSLIASDGIGRLKDVDYNNDGTAYSGHDTFLEHVYKVLTKIGVDDFWGANDDYVLTINDWREQSITYSTGEDPWEYSRIGHEALRTVDSNGENKYTSCYDVLKSICVLWGVRFMLSDGMYRFMQPNEAGETGTVTIRKFDKSQNITVVNSPSLQIWDKFVGEVSEFNTGAKDLYKITSGGFQYYPPLNKVTVDYLHNSTGNIIRYNDITTSTVIEDINSNSSQATIAFQCTINFTQSFTGNFPFHWLKFRLKIEIDGNYLKRTQDIVNDNIATSVISWETDVSYYEVLLFVPHDFGNFRTFGFVTPEIPADGDMTIELTFVEATDGDNIIDPADYTLVWGIDSAYLEIYLTGTGEEQSNTTSYVAENDTAGNTSVIELDTLFGGNSHPNSIQKIQVTDGVGWDLAQNWRRGGSGSYEVIQQLLANEIIVGQLTPVEKYVSQLYYGDYLAHETLVRDAANHLFAGGTHNMKKETWSGTWFYISGNTTGTTPGTPIPTKQIKTKDGLIFLAAPSNQTPGLAVLEIDKDIDLTDLSGGENSPITNTETTIDEGDQLTSIDIPFFNNGDLFLPDDSVVIKDPVTSNQQNFNLGLGGHTPGGTTLDVDESNANFEYKEGSFVLSNPIEQQVNINFGRRKFFHFHMVDLETDLTSSATYVKLPKFWRTPINNSSSITLLYTYIRAAYVTIADNVSDSIFLQYGFRMLRGGTEIATTSISGLTTRSTMTPTALTGNRIVLDDLYTFEYKETLNSGGQSPSKGLTITLEIFNKVFQPEDFYPDLALWYKVDQNITTTLESGVKKITTWGEIITSNDATSVLISRAPIYSLNSLNGYPSALFELDYLRTNPATALLDPSVSNFTMFLVFKTGTMDTVVGEEIIAQSGALGRELIGTSTAKAIRSNLGNTVLTGDTLADDTAYICTLTWDGTTQKIRINGGTASSNTPTAESTTGYYFFGREAAGLKYYTGEMYEFLLLDKAVSDNERKLFETYLAYKYNIAL